jgi:TBC1 domain family member 8/9
MSEEQAFSLLSVLCDRLLPGYYSSTMYGTLLDQKVFESLVEKTMPILWDHLVKSDVQLSVVSLPWFLSLYINSMPLIFAFRVLDVFFLEGPKVLFQIGLAILRINGEDLLDAQDDGTFISVLKSYFARLDESAHPRSENPKIRAITKFQELMVVAFKEFAGITQNTISEQRAKHKEAVLDNIESFAKRTSIRNLGPESKKLSTNDLGFLYDRFYGVLYERQQRAEILQQEAEKRAKAGRAKGTEVVSGIHPQSVEMGRVALGASSSQMDYEAFREFLAGSHTLKLFTRASLLMLLQVLLVGLLRIHRAHHPTPIQKNRTTPILEAAFAAGAFPHHPGVLVLSQPITNSWNGYSAAGM